METDRLAAVDPWDASEEEFLKLTDLEAQLRYLINYAVLAPSKLNTQPWQFLVSRDTVFLFADRRRGLAVTDPDDGCLLMACGSALYNLTLAMRRFGMVPKVLTFPDMNQPDLLASVRVAGIGHVNAETLKDFKAIQRRRTQTGSLEATPVPQSVRDALAAVPGTGASGFRVLSDAGEIRRVGDLVAQAVRRQQRDPHVLRELSSWTHPDRVRSRDGFPQPSHVRSAKSRLSQMNGQLGDELAGPGPILGVVTSRNASHTSRLESGITLARVLIAAARHGLAACFLEDVLEVPELHRQLDAEVGNGDTVHCMMRLGYSTFIRPSPRRFVEEVMVRSGS